MISLKQRLLASLGLQVVLGLRVFMVLGGLQDSFQQRHLQEYQLPDFPTPGPAISLHILSPSPASDFNVLASEMCALEPRLYKRARDAPYRVNIGTLWARTRTALQHRTEDARPPGIWSVGRVVNAARPTGSCSSRTQKASAAGGLGGVVSPWAGPKVPSRPGCLPWEGKEDFSLSGLSCQMRGDLN